LEFLKVALAPHSNRLKVEINKLDQDDIAELRRFGVDTVSKFAMLLNDEFLNSFGGIETTAIGLIRDAMIYADIDRYFETAWSEAWHGWDEDSVRLVEKKYGREKVMGVIKRYSLDFIHSSEFGDDYFDDEISIPNDDFSDGDTHA
jgi:hypothetical protein